MAFLVRIIFCDTESLRKLYWSFQLQVFFSHIFFLEVSKGIREAKQKDWKGTGIKEKKHKPESVSWSTPQMASLDHRCKGPRTTNQEPQRSIQAGMQLCPLFSFSPTKWENEKKKTNAQMSLWTNSASRQPVVCVMRHEVVFAIWSMIVGVDPARGRRGLEPPTSVKTMRLLYVDKRGTVILSSLLRLHCYFFLDLPLIL